MTRPKQDRTTVLARVHPKTTEAVKNVAKALGLTYNQEGSIGKLLDSIATGKVIIVERSLVSTK